MTAPITQTHRTRTIRVGSARIARALLLGFLVGSIGAGYWLAFAPPAVLRGPDDKPLAAWFDDVGALGAVMSGLRWLAIALIFTTLALTALHAIPATGRLARRLTPPLLLPLFVALTSAWSASACAPSSGEAPTEPAWLIERDEAPSSSETPTLATDASDPEPRATGRPAIAEQPSRAQHDRIAEWIVKPGDHLWSIAEWTLEDAWGAPPTDAQTETYWRRLIAANQSILLDPDNADFISPGQVFALPPVSPLSRR